MSEQTIKRIFITGPAGSFYSGCDNRLRTYFKDADNTDITLERQSIENGFAEHQGAYFNVGNEFGDWMLNFDKYNREEITTVLDSVFETQPEKKLLIRFHKSHYFCYHLKQIKELFPDAAIILLTNEPWKCILHWQRCGGFETTYDKYPVHVYNNDYEKIYAQICDMHQTILKFNLDFNLKLEKFDKKFVKKNFNVEYTDTFLQRKPDFNSKHSLYNSSFRNNKSLLSTLKLSIIPWKN